MRVAWAMTVALIVAGCIAALALAVRLARPGGGLPAEATDALPLLFVAASLCAAALLRERLPAGAWLATVVAGGLAAIETVGSVRAWEVDAGPTVWPWLVAMTEVALVAAVAVAAGYALRSHAGTAAGPRPLPTRVWRVLVITVMAGIAAFGAWAIAIAFAGELPLPAAQDGVELSPIRVTGRLAAGFVAVAVVVGLWRDLAGPVGRARSDADGLADLPRALGDELLPTATGFRRRGREEERARLAADLHALVLPDLRRAARAAEASGDAGHPLAADLRHAVEGVERLMHERQSVVLEEFGLVAALEWLAERTQEQRALDVVVELRGAIDDPRALPKPVTRAAFRVAILAVDNILRHADASRVELRLEVRGATIGLSVVDDGRGPSSSPGPARGRGLADMRTAATEVGASVEVRSAPDGTTVEFRWAGAGPVAADHATLIADSADRPNAPLR